jgi:arsenical pump membrane protein
MAPFHQILLILIVAVSIVLMLIRPKNIPEVYWVGAGALLLIVLRLIPLRLAGKAVGDGLDVYLFLTGMMLLSELAREHGVFDWLSSVAMRHAGGSGLRLFLLIYLAGTLVTASMSNDATAVVLTPAVLSVVRRSKADPVPHLFACAMVANAASFVLPISNPANLVVFHAGMPPLGRWLLFFGVPSLFSIVVTFCVLWWYFQRPLSQPVEEQFEDHPLEGNGRFVVAGLVVVTGVLLAASALHKDLGLPTCLAAVAIVAVVSWKAKSNPLTPARHVSWSTLGLVAALFILVNAAESAGALEYVREGFSWVEHLPAVMGAFVTAFTTGFANNLLNNLPVGLIAGAVLAQTQVKQLLINSALIGVDLGPNLSVTGSLATILWLLALRRERLNVSFGDFLKVGVLAMPVALLASVFGLLLVEKIW